MSAEPLNPGKKAMNNKFSTTFSWKSEIFQTILDINYVHFLQFQRDFMP